MKVKLLSVLTVSLLTLALISPGIAVFNLVWGQHREFLKTQNLSCESQTIKIASSKDVSTKKIINSQPSLLQTKSSKNVFLHQLQTVVKKYQILNILQWIFLITPICTGVLILAYDRYLVYRSAVLKAQIAMLERMWQEGIEQ